MQTTSSNANTPKPSANPQYIDKTPALDEFPQNCWRKRYLTNDSSAAALEGLERNQSGLKIK